MDTLNYNDLFVIEISMIDRLEICAEAHMVSKSVGDKNGEEYWREQQVQVFTTAEKLFSAERFRGFCELAGTRVGQVKNRKNFERV